MAEMKIDITKAVKDTAEKALDEYQYKGHTIREWADKITSGKYQPVKHGSWSEKQGEEQESAWRTSCAAVTAKEKQREGVAGNTQRRGQVEQIQKMLSLWAIRNRVQPT